MMEHLLPHLQGCETNGCMSATPVSSDGPGPPGISKKPSSPLPSGSESHDDSPDTLSGQDMIIHSTFL